jgi:flagellar L-ring protein precursor FlgH
MKLKSTLLLLITLSVTSCANYVNKIHRELDRDMYMSNQRQQPEAVTQDDHFNQFRQTNNTAEPRGFYHPSAQRPLSQQQNFQSQRRVSSHQQRQVEPEVRRQYTPENEVRRRYKAQDMVDNQGGASLWAGNGRGNFLLSTNDERRDGDIVLINVNKKLKDEMTLELKRIFPDAPQRPNQVAGAGATDPNQVQATTPAPTGPSPASAAAPEIFDRISSVIIERVNNDHYLLRGRKHVLYKNFKRLVEVQALVSKRDILSDNTINSDTILETSVSVIR